MSQSCQHCCRCTYIQAAWKTIASIEIQIIMKLVLVNISSVLLPGWLGSDKQWINPNFCYFLFLIASLNSFNLKENILQNLHLCHFMFELLTLINGTCRQTDRQTDRIYLLLRERTP